MGQAESKHTPGPWGLSHVEDGGIRHLVPIDADGTSLLTVVHEGGYDGGEVTPFAAVYSDQDARLIAAAPELLEALQDLTLNVREAMKTGGWVPTPLHRSFWDSMSDALAAIANATGAK